MSNVSKELKESECIVPNFYGVARSSIETALEMSFNANRVATLAEELTSVRDEQIDYLTHGTSQNLGTADQ